ncbi:hypothetical protein GLOTRDRAFT_134545, partial [Gloeophyllum trabeum ATCC 11539]
MPEPLPYPTIPAIDGYLNSANIERLDGRIVMATVGFLRRTGDIAHCFLPSNGFYPISIHLRPGTVIPPGVHYLQFWGPVMSPHRLDHRRMRELDHPFESISMRRLSEDIDRATHPAAMHLIAELHPSVW